MKPPKGRAKGKKKEKAYEKELRAYMHEQGWHTEKTHGNAFQEGFPDLYCMHPKFGTRWVEMKRPEDGRLKASQIKKFSLWQAHGVGVWILTGPKDYKKLWDPPNWFRWLDPLMRKAETGR